jgi:ribonuclease P protein component
MFYMLKKTSRLTRKDIPAVLKGGVFYAPLFTLRYRKSPLSYSRFAVIVSKKTEKSAAERNKIRRRGYEALRMALAENKPAAIIDAAVFMKKESLRATLSSLVQEVTRVLPRRQ